MASLKITYNCVIGSKARTPYVSVSVVSMQSSYSYLGLKLVEKVLIFDWKIYQMSHNTAGAPFLDTRKGANLLMAKHLDKTPYKPLAYENHSCMRPDLVTDTLWFPEGVR